MSGLHGDIIYTVDGGINWTLSNYSSEQYQPVGIAGTTIFFVLAEGPDLSGTQSGSLIRSDDVGATWRKIYQYHNSSYNSVTGTIQSNSRALFFQTMENGSEGIMMSIDSGATFHSIWGPINE